MRNRNVMKIQMLNPKGFEFLTRSRTGMTLVEVAMAMFITGVTVSGIISGYVYCTTAAVKAELAQAANARAMERLEQTRGAIWAPDRPVPVDELTAGNFPDRTVSLDLPGGGSNGVPVTIQTVITNLPLTPPMRLIHVDCIWQFRGAERVTNSVETIRAADQ